MFTRRSLHLFLFSLFPFPFCLFSFPDQLVPHLLLIFFFSLSPPPLALHIVRAEPEPPQSFRVPPVVGPLLPPISTRCNFALPDPKRSFPACRHRNCRPLRKASLKIASALNKGRLINHRHFTHGLLLTVAYLHFSVVCVFVCSFISFRRAARDVPCRLSLCCPLTTSPPPPPETPPPAHPHRIHRDSSKAYWPDRRNFHFEPAPNNPPGVLACQGSRAIGGRRTYDSFDSRLVGPAWLLSSSIHILRRHRRRRLTQALPRCSGMEPPRGKRSQLRFSTQGNILIRRLTMARTRNAGGSQEHAICAGRKK